MRQIILCAFFTFLVFISSTIFLKAQDVNTTSAKLKKNFLKLNITAMVLKNYSLQYERALNKSFSVAVAFRTMPSTAIPFKNTILNIINDEDPEVKRTIETFRLGNIAVTPEIRFYPGRKGYGRGFYMAPFYRYASFKSSNFDLNYDDNNGTSGIIKLSGKLTTNTGGLLFGLQHSIGRHLVYDLWFFGPHFGSGTGLFSGLSDKTLTTSEQNAIRDELDDIDIPFTDKTIRVNSNGASLQLSGPWGGIRGGISLGVKF